MAVKKKTDDGDDKLKEVNWNDKSIKEARLLGRNDLLPPNTVIKSPYGKQTDVGRTVDVDNNGEGSEPDAKSESPA